MINPYISHRIQSIRVIQYIIIYVKYSVYNWGILGVFRFKCSHLLHPAVAHGDFVVFPVVDLFYGPANMAHKLSSACAEMILSYHLLSQQIFFTHNWNLSRHCFVVVWLFVFCVVCFCFCLFLVLFLLLVLCVSVLVLGNVTRE